jgi:molecular chaperone GrpE
MNDEKASKKSDALDSEEFELDAEDAQDLEAAMQEALEAVEGASLKEAVEPGNDATEVTVNRLESELADLRDQSIRTLADFDNYRKRIERERREDQRFAFFDLVRKLLPVIDNLERAAAAEGSLEDLKAGVELILRQLEELMSSIGVGRIEAKGEAFDPQFHEAVSRIEDPSVSAPTVSEELQSGYLMHERLVRPSVVTVVVPVEDEPAENSDAEA